MMILHHLSRDRKLRTPDLVGIMLDPARIRENLPKLLLRDTVNATAAIEQDRARTGGALVYRQNILVCHANLTKSQRSQR